MVESFIQQDNETYILNEIQSYTPDQTSRNRILENLGNVAHNDISQESVISEMSSDKTKMNNHSIFGQRTKRVFKILITYTSGFLISSAYMDPGNYSVNVNTGAQNKYALLCVVLLSSLIAVFLQCLCIKLGSVTGLDLARNCKKNLNKYLNMTLWVFAQCAIIATDISEVIGTSIALNILIKIPLYGGVLLTSLDIMLVLVFFKPNGSNSLKTFKIYELCVASLVLGVTVCFGIELGYLPSGTSVRQIFRGFIPSHQLFENDGILNSTSVLGATVMPHSLYVGSSIVFYRMIKYDIEKGNFKENDIEENKLSNIDTAENENDMETQEEQVMVPKPKFMSTNTSPGLEENEIFVNIPEENAINEYDISNSLYTGYKPSIGAIDYCLKSSAIEMTIILMSVALFVNAAIVIMAGATLYGSAEAAGASIYTIHNLLSNTLSKSVGTIFIIALLLSGECASMLCAQASCILDGHLKARIANVWQTRLVIRSISIVPALIISLVVGKSGINKALNITQVILSVILPFISLPIFYFTSRKKYMVVVENGIEKDYTNNWLTIFVCVVVWIFITVLNIYMIIQSV